MSSTMEKNSEANRTKDEKEDKEIKTSSDINEEVHKIFPGLSFQSSVLTTSQLTDVVNLILPWLQKNPPVIELIKKNLSQGKIVVEFDLHKNMTAHACWNEASRSIKIATRSMKPHDILSSLIFELYNADNKAMRIELADYDDAEAFATALETAEDITAVNHAKMMLESIEKCGWPIESDYALDSKEDLLKISRMSFAERREMDHTPSIAHHGFSHYQNYVHVYHLYKRAILRHEREKIVFVIELAQKTDQAKKAHLKYEKKLMSEFLPKLQVVLDNYLDIKEGTTSEDPDLDNKIEALQKQILEIEQKLKASEDIQVEPKDSKEHAANIKQLEELEKQIRLHEDAINTLGKNAKECLIVLEKNQTPQNTAILRSIGAVQNRITEKFQSIAARSSTFNADTKNLFLEYLTRGQSLCTEIKEIYRLDVSIIDSNVLKDLLGRSKDLEKASQKLLEDLSKRQTSSGVLRWLFGSCCRKRSVKQPEAKTTVKPN